MGDCDKETFVRRETSEGHRYRPAGSMVVKENGRTLLLLATSAPMHMRSGSIKVEAKIVAAAKDDSIPLTGTRTENNDELEIGQEMNGDRG